VCVHGKCFVAFWRHVRAWGSTAGRLCSCLRRFPQHAVQFWSPLQPRSQSLVRCLQYGGFGARRGMLVRCVGAWMPPTGHGCSLVCRVPQHEVQFWSSQQPHMQQRWSRQQFWKFLRRLDMLDDLRAPCVLPSWCEFALGLLPSLVHDVGAHGRCAFDAGMSVRPSVRDAWCSQVCFFVTCRSPLGLTCLVTLRGLGRAACGMSLAVQLGCPCMVAAAGLCLFAWDACIFGMDPHVVPAFGVRLSMAARVWRQLLSAAL